MRIPRSLARMLCVIVVLLDAIARSTVSAATGACPLSVTISGFGSCTNGTIGSTFTSIGTSPVTFNVSSQNVQGAGNPTLSIQDNTGTFQTSSGTISATGGNVGFTINQSTQSFTLTPTTSSISNASVHVRAIDASSATATQTFTFWTGGGPPSNLLAVAEQGTGQIDFYTLTLGTTSDSFTPFTVSTGTNHLAVTNSTNENKADVDSPQGLLFDSTGSLLIANSGQGGADTGSFACIPTGAIDTGFPTSVTNSTNANAPQSIAIGTDSSVALANKSSTANYNLVEYLLGTTYSPAPTQRNIANPTSPNAVFASDVAALATSAANPPGTFAAAITNGSSISRVAIDRPDNAETDITDSTIVNPKAVGYDVANSQLVIANSNGTSSFLDFYDVTTATPSKRMAFLIRDNGGSPSKSQITGEKLAVSADGHVAVGGVSAFGHPAVQVYGNTTSRAAVGGPIPFDSTTTPGGSTFTYGDTVAVTSLRFLTNTKLLVMLSSSDSTKQGVYIYDISQLAAPGGFDARTGSATANSPAQTGFLNFSNTPPLAAAFNGSSSSLPLSSGNPPRIGESFSPTKVAAGVASTMTFSINNPYAGAINASFADSLPADLVVAPMPNVVNSCGGSVTATAGSSAINFSNSALASGQCTIKVDVQATTDGVFCNTAQITSTTTGDGNIATATLNVVGPATHFDVSAPSSATAGSASTFTVTARDQIGDQVTDYSGTVHFTSSDGQAVLPADSTLSGGSGSFSATLDTAGSQTVTATDTAKSSITGTSNSVAVSASAATHFAVTVPGSATAGSAFSFAVTAQDQFGNTATSYTGTVHFTSSDGQAVLPANTTLTNGTGTFSATLESAGVQTITATDTANSSIAGTSNSITVGAAAATHFTVSAPSSATAGTVFNFTVTAQDQFSNTATGYSGKVHFTSSDGQAVLPANSTLTNGTGTLAATLKTAGTQTITATDTANSSIAGTSNSIAVGPAAATHFTVTAPGTAAAGTAFNFTVIAFDQFNNTAIGYSGAVHFTSSDAQAVLPVDSTLTNGSGTFSATLKTGGSQTITATDTASSSITGTSNSTAVSAAAATHFAVSAPSSVSAGTAFNFTVTAKDQFSNTATAYTGTVHFTSTDAQAVLPANSTLTNGTGTFSATLKTAGSETITATDTASSSITGTSNSITVGAAAATHFTVTAPSSATAGTGFNFTVIAFDQFNNTATGYNGTVHFTCSDAQAVLPGDTGLTNGTGTFSATLKTAGSQTITATDVASSSITGTSGSITESAAAATHFVVTGPSSATAGSASNLSVTAQDQFSNTATGYTGTVGFTSSDAQAVLPDNSTLTNGTGTFSATLKTAGSQTITVTDTASSAITGTSNSITVSAAAGTHFAVSAPSSVSAGSAFNLTVTAKDDSNNTAIGYSGTVHFTSSDGQAVLPADSTLTNGTGSFSATLKTAGNETITATDAASSAIAGTSNSITVNPAVATHFAVGAPSSASAGTAFNFTVTVKDDSNNTATGYSGTIHFTSSDAQAALPANATLTNGAGSFSATLKTSGNQTVTATDTVSSSIAGTSSTIAVSAASATHYALAAPASATAGTAFNFTIVAQDQFNNTAPSYAGTVRFTSSDGQAILPANGTLTNGIATLSATLKTAGNQTLSATDTVTSSITGASNAINVAPAAASHYTVAAPASVTSGVAFNFTVTALDQFSNTATGYAGTAHFTSSDAQAVLPANSTLPHGTGTFSATLKALGAQSLTATDTVTAGTTGTSNVTVNAGAATHLVVSTPANATAGSAFNFTVTAQDQFNNIASGYTGTIHFTTTDRQAGLPADTALTNGVGTLSATMKTAGQQTITGTDKASTSINGTSSAINVGAASATHFTVSAPASASPNTAFNFTVTARDQFNNTATGYAGTVHFTSSDAQAVLPTDSTLTSGVGTFSATLKTTGNQTITGTDKTTSSITGTSSAVSVAAASATPTPSPSASPTATATASPTATPSAAATVSPTATPTATVPLVTALNVSTRVDVGTGDHVAIGGFIVTGAGEKNVIIRAIGPSLAASGVTGFLADPTLELHTADGSLITTNDDWKTSQQAAITAAGVAPTDDREAAVVAMLMPGAYTAVMQGKNNTTGIGLLEIYDLNANAISRLANISTRGFVETQDNVVIGGFMLGGSNTSSRVFIRGLGPSLAAAGVTNVLSDPMLDLRDGNGQRVVLNDNWQDDSAEASSLTAAGIPLSDSSESGISSLLLPGSYTVILSGVNSATGNALLEIYIQ